MDAPHFGGNLIAGSLSGISLLMCTSREEWAGMDADCMRNTDAERISYR